MPNIVLHIKGMLGIFRQCQSGEKGIASAAQGVDAALLRMLRQLCLQMLHQGAVVLRCLALRRTAVAVVGQFLVGQQGNGGQNQQQYQQGGKEFEQHGNFRKQGFQAA